MEHEFFIVANSFAAPICSDTSMHYVKGTSDKDALSNFIKSYNHPAGLYAANLYENADAYHKGKEALAVYRHPSIEEQKKHTTGD